MATIHISEIKRYLGLDAADTSQDTLLTELETAAVSFLENETLRYFGPAQAVVERYNGHGEVSLFLKEAPMVGPSLTVEVWDGSQWQAESAGRYEVAGRELIHVYGWPEGQKNIRVSYTRGYDLGTAPKDVNNAILALIAHTYRRRGKEGIQSETLGGYRYQLSELPLSEIPGLVATIHHHKRFHL